METAPKKRYTDKFQLLNKSELELFNNLEEAMPKLVVFAQVSMSQVFHLNLKHRDTFSKLGEIGRKSIDFLVCRREDTSIVAAIELNGPTHNIEKQQASDEEKRAALEEAGIPLMIYTPDNLPDVNTIRKTIIAVNMKRKRLNVFKKTLPKAEPKR